MDSDKDEPDIEVDFEDFIGTVFYKPPLKKNTYSLTYTNNINIVLFSIIS